MSGASSPLDDIMLVPGVKGIGVLIKLRVILGEFKNKSLHSSISFSLLLLLLDIIELFLPRTGVNDDKKPGE
jgi:hypothetical protein